MVSADSKTGAGNRETSYPPHHRGRQKSHLIVSETVFEMGKFDLLYSFFNTFSHA